MKFLLLLCYFFVFSGVLRAYQKRSSSSHVKSTLHTPSHKFGDPLIVTWSIVRDGSKMLSYSSTSQSTGKSNLIQRLDEIYNVPESHRTEDLTQRPWFKVFSDALNKYTIKTGLTYIYEPNDDGSSIVSTGAKAIKGQRADLRISGQTLGFPMAYSYFAQDSKYYPSIVFNTGHPTFSSKKTLDFLLVHENMHALGSKHMRVNNNDRLTAVAANGGGTGQGPQFDDLLTLHMRYGDFNEKSEGNDQLSLATVLGELTESHSLKIGFDAKSLQVKSNQTDFVSIDDKSDIDYYKFTLTKQTPIQIILTPRGPEYEYLEEDAGKNHKVNTSKLNDLKFTMYNSNGVAKEINLTKAGEAEIFNTNPPAGDYYIAVEGKSKNSQFYSLEIANE